MKKIIFLIVLSISTENGAVLTDAALLVQVASSTASTVTNTLDILEVAKKTGEKIDHYNTLAVRQLYKARRLERHVRDMAMITSMEPADLRELNRELSRLKTGIRGLRDTVDAIALDVRNANGFARRHRDKVANSKQDETDINTQELLSADGGPSGNHIQNTAINTALTGKVLNKMRRDNLEYQKIDLAIKRNNSVRELRRQQFYKEWLR